MGTMKRILGDPEHRHLRKKLLKEEGETLFSEEESMKRTMKGLKMENIRDTRQYRKIQKLPSGLRKAVEKLKLKKIIKRLNQKFGDSVFIGHEVLMGDGERKWAIVFTGDWNSYNHDEKKRAIFCRLYARKEGLLVFGCYLSRTNVNSRKDIEWIR